jgi:hypothetical protein
MPTALGRQNPGAGIDTPMLRLKDGMAGLVR